MKKAIIPLVLVLLVGLGWYVSKGANEKNVGDKVTDSMGEKVSELKGEAFSGSMAAAVKLGVPMKCTYTVDGMESEGYIKGKNYRGSMKSATAEENAEVIMKDNCMWTWSEESGEGMTTCYNPEEADKVMWEEMNEEEEMMNTPKAEESVKVPDVDYNCVPAIVSDELFTPPTNVKFVDLEKMFNSQGMPDLSEFEGMMEGN